MYIPDYIKRNIYDSLLVLLDNYIKDPDCYTLQAYAGWLGGWCIKDYPERYQCFKCPLRKPPHWEGYVIRECQAGIFSGNLTLSEILLRAIEFRANLLMLLEDEHANQEIRP